MPEQPIVYARGRGVEVRELRANVRVRRDLERTYVAVWDIPTELFDLLHGELHEHNDFRCRAIDTPDGVEVTLYEAKTPAVDALQRRADEVYAADRAQDANEAVA